MLIGKSYTFWKNSWNFYVQSRRVLEIWLKRQFHVMYVYVRLCMHVYLFKFIRVCIDKYKYNIKNSYKFINYIIDININ